MSKKSKRRKEKMKKIADKIKSGEEVTNQTCDLCRRKFIFLKPSKQSLNLCYTCSIQQDGIQEVTQAKMSDYQKELWENPLPDDFAELIKRRSIKRELVLTGQDLEDGDEGELLNHMENMIRRAIRNKIESKNNVEDKELIEVFDETVKEFDDYPEVTPSLRKTFEKILRTDFDRYLEGHKSHMKRETTEKERLMNIVKNKIKPDYYKKIEKIMDLWISECEKPLEEITEAEILSSADGAIHNVEKHKEMPNGFCKECDEYYSNGSIKTKLTDALETIDESIKLYEKQRMEVFKADDQNTSDEVYQQEIAKYSKKLKADFQNTPQEKVDDFIRNIKTENNRIKEESRLAREKKKQEIVMKTWNEARSLIRKQSLFTQTDYENYSKSDDFPEDMHPQPHLFYKEWKELKGKTLSEQYKDFLGAEGRTYNFRKDPKAHKRQTVKVSLEELQNRFEHYCTLTPGFLVTWFKSAGLFHHRDKGIRAFVRQFIETEKTPEGKKELYEALSKTIFNLQVGHFPKGEVDSTPLPESSKTYLDQKSSSTKKQSPLLEKVQTQSVKSIIENAREVVPITKDTRVWNLHVEIVKAMIFKQIFDPNREMFEIDSMMREEKNGNPFHDEVMSRFWEEYNGMKQIKFWKPDYSFKVGGQLKDPTLNQIYTAYKMRKLNGFCNFSDPGTGKTNAAYLATRNPDIRYVLIIAPFNITKQWVTALENIYPHSFISSGKIPYKDWSKGSYDKYYHVINYEKFSRDRGKLVSELANFPIDFVIIDEAHHTKIRNESSFSHTRLQIEKLLTKLRSSNRKLKCLMLSATPVINNVQEGKSILEMVTGTRYPDLKTINNLGNATELHSEFIPFSVRYEKTYENITQEGRDKPITVHATIPEFLTPEEKRKLSWMELEQICTKARIPEIVKKLKRKTIIYTDYVGGNPRLGLSILEQLKRAVEGEGYKVGFFTGEEISPGIGGKGGLEDWSNCKVINNKRIPYNPFVDGDLDVIIASSSIAEGINELQYVSDNLIFNGLVWTFADFKQIVGRLVREGQKSKTVTISLILSTLNGYEYDLKIKLNRLELKKILGNCVLDGTLPDLKKLPNTKKEFAKMMEAILKEHKSTIKIPIKQKENPNERA